MRLALRQLALIAIICTAATGAKAWFLFLPGSAFDALDDMATGAKGGNCITSAAKVGDLITLPDGTKHRVLELSGTSSRCQDPNWPIRALLGPAEQPGSTREVYQSKVTLDLPNGWMAVSLTPELQSKGFFFQALNKTIDAGLLLIATRRSEISNVAQFVKTRQMAQVAALLDGSYSEIKEIHIKKLRAWQFKVSGQSRTTKNNYSYVVVIVEGPKELVEMKTWMLTALIAGHESELVSMANHLSGM